MDAFRTVFYNKTNTYLLNSNLFTVISGNSLMFPNSSAIISRISKIIAWGVMALTAISY